MKRPKFKLKIMELDFYQELKGSLKHIKDKIRVKELCMAGVAFVRMINEGYKRDIELK